MFVFCAKEGARAILPVFSANQPSLVSNFFVFTKQQAFLKQVQWKLLDFYSKICDIIWYFKLWICNMKPVEKMTYLELLEAQQRHKKILSNKYVQLIIVSITIRIYSCNILYLLIDVFFLDLFFKNYLIKERNLLKQISGLKKNCKNIKQKRRNCPKCYQGWHCLPAWEWMSTEWNGQGKLIQPTHYLNWNPTISSQVHMMRVQI